MPSEPYAESPRALREVESLEAAKLHLASAAKYESRRSYRCVARLDDRGRLDPQLVRHAIKLGK